MEQCPNCQRELTANSRRLGYCEFCGFPISDKPTPTPPFPLSLQRALTSEELEKAPDDTPTLLPTARKKKRLTDFGSQLMRLSPGKHNSKKLQPATDATEPAMEETEDPHDDEAIVEESAPAEAILTSAETSASAAEVFAPDEQALREDDITVPPDESAEPTPQSTEGMREATATAQAPTTTPPPPSFVVPVRDTPTTSAPASSPASFTPAPTPATPAPASLPSAPLPTASPYPLPPAPPPWQMPTASYSTPGFAATNAPISEASQPLLPVQPESGQSRSDEYSPMPTMPSAPLYSGPGMVQSYPSSDAYMRATPMYPTPNVTVFLPPGALPQSAPTAAPTPTPVKARRTGRGFFAGCLTALIVIVAASAGVVTWGLKNGYSIPAIVGPTTATQSPGTAVPTVPTGFTTFVAPDNDYRLIYPVNWQQAAAIATGDVVTKQTFTSPDEAYQVSLAEQSSLLASGEYPTFFTTYLQPYTLSNLQMATATQPVAIGTNQWLLLKATATYHDSAYTLKMYGVNHVNHTIVFVTMTPTAAETIAEGQFFQPMLSSLQLLG